MGKSITTNIQIRFSDIDAMGHVNNAVYLNYFEFARTHYFKELLDENWDWRKEGILLANNTINYFKPVLLTDEVITETKCVKIGTKSFVLECNLFVIKEESKEKYTSGSATLVSFNYDTNESIEIPSKMKKALEL